MARWRASGTAAVPALALGALAIVMRVERDGDREVDVVESRRPPRGSRGRRQWALAVLALLLGLALGAAGTWAWYERADVARVEVASSRLASSGDRIMATVALVNTGDAPLTLTGPELVVPGFEVRAVGFLPDTSHSWVASGGSAAGLRERAVLDPDADEMAFGAGAVAMVGAMLELDCAQDGFGVPTLRLDSSRGGGHEVRLTRLRTHHTGYCEIAPLQGHRVATTYSTSFAIPPREPNLFLAQTGIRRIATAAEESRPRGVVLERMTVLAPGLDVALDYRRGHISGLRGFSMEITVEDCAEATRRPGSLRFELALRNPAGRSSVTVGSDGRLAVELARWVTATCEQPGRR